MTATAAAATSTATGAGHDDGRQAPRVGVLALQGGVVEHERLLEGVGAAPRRVRRPADLAGLDALVVPGGESSVLDRLLDVAGLREPLRAEVAAGLPTLGTCAGLVLLSAGIDNPAPGQRTLGLLDVSVRRNAFGRQVDSAETWATWRVGAQDPAGCPGGVARLRAAAIRAPEVTRVGPGVEVVSTMQVEGTERVVGVRGGGHGHVLGLALHPELTGDDTAHLTLLGLLVGRRAR